VERKKYHCDEKRFSLGREKILIVVRKNSRRGKSLFSGVVEFVLLLARSFSIYRSPYPEV